MSLEKVLGVATCAAGLLAVSKNGWFRDDLYNLTSGSGYEFTRFVHDFVYSPLAQNVGYAALFGAGIGAVVLGLRSLENRDDCK